MHPPLSSTSTKSLNINISNNRCNETSKEMTTETVDRLNNNNNYSDIDADDKFSETNHLNEDDDDEVDEYEDYNSDEEHLNKREQKQQDNNENVESDYTAYLNALIESNKMNRNYCKLMKQICLQLTKNSDLMNDDLIDSVKKEFETNDCDGEDVVAAADQNDNKLIRCFPCKFKNNNKNKFLNLSDLKSHIENVKFVIFIPQSSIRNPNILIIKIII